jgi:uncharacterized protein YceH (UPF0502 family)
VKERFGWEKPQRAVLAELLLRGPQTIGELRTRCARMYPFDNTEAVAAVLDTLSQTDPPQVEMLPRVPGQSTVRWAHKLYYAEEWSALTANAAPAASARPAVPSPPADDPSVREEIEALRAAVAELRDRVTVLEQRA